MAARGEAVLERGRAFAAHLHTHRSSHPQSPFRRAPPLDTTRESIEVLACDPSTLLPRTLESPAQKYYSV